MKDRVTQYPHRYQLVPVSGQSDTYDIIAKPGTVTEVGTPINKATLLKDETATLYGLTGGDATVDGALGKALMGRKLTSVSGNVAYTDSLAASGELTKYIAIGPDKNVGMCIIRQSAGTYGVISPGVLILFSRDNLETWIVGSSKDANGGTAGTRRHVGAVMDGQIGFGSAGSGSSAGAIQIRDLYIEGDTIRIDFLNSTADKTRDLGCTIDWEVW